MKNKFRIFYKFSSKKWHIGSLIYSLRCVDYNRGEKPLVFLLPSPTNHPIVWVLFLLFLRVDKASLMTVDYRAKSDKQKIIWETS